MYFTTYLSVCHDDIVMGLHDAGVESENILSTQRCLNSNTWVVSFHSVKARNTASFAWYITNAGQHVFSG